MVKREAEFEDGYIAYRRGHLTTDDLLCNGDAPW